MEGPNGDATKTETKRPTMPWWRQRWKAWVLFPTSIGTASNDSNACFFWITRNEESQICSYTVLFFTGFSDASYSLSLFTQEASSTSSSVQYYYSWKKSKNKNFPVKSLMEGMNTNMGTFSPKEWLSLKLLTTRQIRSKPLNLNPHFNKSWFWTFLNHIPKR